MAKGRTMKLTADELEGAAQRRAEEAQSSVVVIPPNVTDEEVLYVARPQGRKVTKRENIRDEDGHGRTVVNDYLYTAFYGPFIGREAVETFLRAKRGRGTIDFIDGVNVVTEAEARRIKAVETGNDLN